MQQLFALTVYDHLIDRLTFVFHHIFISSPQVTWQCLRLWCWRESRAETKGSVVRLENDATSLQCCESVLRVKFMVDSHLRDSLERISCNRIVMQCKRSYIGIVGKIQFSNAIQFSVLGSDIQQETDICLIESYSFSLMIILIILGCIRWSNICVNWLYTRSPYVGKNWFQIFGKRNPDMSGCSLRSIHLFELKLNICLWKKLIKYKLLISINWFHDFRYKRW